ncbi:MAG TPA: Rap1a/Tai family immunity protein [Alphaproteobacteria bacterium]|nr:Rap1a/Tai family immunity protein [Alphaproteobacteria bacterium]
MSLVPHARRKRRGFLAAWVFVVLAGGSVFPAHAREFSADYLLQMCSSTRSGAEMVPGGHIACQSYLAGVIDYHVLLRSLGTAPSVDFCIPPDIELDTIQKVVTLYLMRNRQHDSFVAAPAVALALYQTWPCRVQSGRKK